MRQIDGVAPPPKGGKTLAELCQVQSASSGQATTVADAPDTQRPIINEQKKKHDPRGDGSNGVIDANGNFTIPME